MSDFITSEVKKAKSFQCEMHSNTSFAKATDVRRGGKRKIEMRKEPKKVQSAQEREGGFVACFGI